MQITIFRKIQKLLKKNLRNLKEVWWKVVPPEIWHIYPKKPILVYQPGKVASSAIVKSLNKSGIRALQTHNFSESYRLRNIEKAILKGINGWRVITLVRDPVAQRVSGFFQNLSHQGHPGYIGSEEQVKKMSWKELEQLFITKAIKKETIFDMWPISWYRKVFEKTFKIDLFEQAFKKEKGYEIYHFLQADVLLIRFENLKTIGAKAIQNFTGSNHFLLSSYNVSEEKYYKSLYKEFKEKVKLPKEFVEKFYKSKEVRHFYTEAELRQFSKKWKVDLN